VNNKCVVLLSGGLDSTTLLAYMKYINFEVLPISIYYGQRHKHELDAAEAICKHYGLEWKGFDMSFGSAHLFKGSSQTDNIPVPHGHYEDASMKVTVVPNRNMILLSLATAYAISNDARVVAYAAHAGDHAIYPDCRPQFAEAMKRAIAGCHFEYMELDTPFIRKSKADIVALGAQLHVPFNLTWSCYDPQLSVSRYIHCGECGTCVERKEAFTLAGIPDPTEYAK
jgi:7-cyano-7-deazaguanine synthase